MNLYEEQRRLEEEATAAGYRRFEKRLRRAEEAGRSTEEGGGKKLLREALVNMALAVGKLCHDAGTRGPTPPIVKWANAIGHDVIAYLTLKATLDAVLGAARKDSRYAPGKIPLNVVVAAITRLVKDELKMKVFKAKEPGLYQYKMERFDTNNYAHRLRSMRATMKWAEIEDHDLIKPGHELRLGVQLLDVLIQTTGLVEHRTVQSNRKHRSSNGSKVPNRELIVVPTERTLEWIAQRNNFMSLLEPIFKPMVIPPAPWDREQPGGYWFEQAGKLPLVRGRDHRENRLIHNHVDMPEVYAALNAVQETAWSINNYVLKAVQVIQQGGRERGGILTFEQKPLPPKPPDIDTNRDARRQWKYEAKLVHDQNAAHRNKVIEQARTIATAQSVCEYREIFFPHSLDFRGRLYPAVPYLSPQGDDLSRALLMFAHGKRIKGSERYLAIHGANCMGEHNGLKLDKATADERVAWVHQHSDAIVRSGNDFEAEKFWEQAEKPLQFLAFCFEWAWYKKVGDTFVSRLPVAQDGTCNGLQHYAALTRDSGMAQHVNLMPGDRPADIYQVICDAVEDRLNTDCHDGSDLACEWIMSGLVTRSLVKRPVMTYPYGTNVYGITDTLRDDLPSSGTPPDLKNAFRYLAQTIWDTMETVVTGAHRTMQCLQEIVRRQLRANDAPLVWVTPLGFPVIQSYNNYTFRQINTELAGCPIYPSVYFTAPGVMKHRHVNGIAPNFIHSLDATALMMTVNAAVKLGLTEFGMVHDSYATLAADAGTLADVIRVQFYKMYTEYSILDSFYKDMQEQYPKDEDVVPDMKVISGDLSMDHLLRSRYFFH